MDIYKLLVIAVTLEALWETLKMVWQEGKANIDRIGAAALGVFLCVAAGVDFYEMVEIPLVVPYAGMVLSGILVSRGANIVHDIFSAINNLKTSSK